MKNSIVMKNALTILALIAGWFGFAWLLGQEDNLIMKAANFLFVAWGIHRAISQWRKESPEGAYFQGLGMGFRTGFAAVAMAVIGFMVFATISGQSLDISGFAPALLAGAEIDLFTYCFALFIEGMASVMVLSLLVMQAHKNESKVLSSKSLNKA